MFWFGHASADCGSQLRTHFDFGSVKVEIFDKLGRGQELGYGHADFAAAAEAVHRVWRKSLPRTPRDFRVHVVSEAELGPYFGRYRDGELYLNLERLLRTSSNVDLRFKVIFVAAHEAVHATQEAWGEPLVTTADNPNYDTDIYEDEANLNAMAVLKAMHPDLVLGVEFAGRSYHIPKTSDY